MDTTTPKACMDRFTTEQAQRMRCAIQHYRPNVVTTTSTCTDDDGRGSSSSLSAAVYVGIAVGGGAHA